jgi:Domain of unknown function (DUF4926)
MSQYQLFDTIKLKEDVPLETGSIASAGTSGAIVEIFKDGKAYLVELFGNWVTATTNGDFVASSADHPDAFMETIGLEIVEPHQIYLVTPAYETMGARAQLLALMEELPEETLKEVANFAEFLKQKQTLLKKVS